MNTQTETIRIIIVEDFELAREGLGLSILRKSRFEVCGEAENGQVACDLVKELQPDVVLMDIAMPVMDGISATQWIKANYPEIRVIMLTSMQDGDEVYASMAAGADAYCMKDIKIERLLQVIEMVHEGAIWLDPKIARQVMSVLPGAPTMRSRSGAARQSYNTELTQREMEVLELLVKGLNNKEIAETLTITGHTVKVHVSNIIQKLAVDDRTQAAVKALREGLISKS